MDRSARQLITLRRAWPAPTGPTFTPARQATLVPRIPRIRRRSSSSPPRRPRPAQPGRHGFWPGGRAASPWRSACWSPCSGGPPSAGWGGGRPGTAGLSGSLPGRRERTGAQREPSSIRLSPDPDHLHRYRHQLLGAASLEDAEGPWAGEAEQVLFAWASFGLSSRAGWTWRSSAGRRCGSGWTASRSWPPGGPGPGALGARKPGPAAGRHLLEVAYYRGEGRWACGWP